MGTKNNPGKFDCYANAKPDEPMFILLGRDPIAGALVRLWAEMRKKIGLTSSDKLKEANDCADAMEKYAVGVGKSLTDSRTVFKSVLKDRYDYLPKGPSFILSPEDPASHLLVTFWIRINEITGSTSDRRLEEAKRLATRMEDHARKLGIRSDDAWKAYTQLLERDAADNKKTKKELQFAVKEAEKKTQKKGNKA